MPPSGDEGTAGSDVWEGPRAHLEDVDDGCGCAELWEVLSERRSDGTSD